MTHDDWMMMGHQVGGIGAMGGPAVALLRRPEAAGHREH